MRLEHSLYNNAAAIIFQFHKGAIRTLVEKSLRTHSLNFNSIKVRLERNALQKRSRALVFQFHKGAIRTSAFIQNADAKPQFQFHKGAIRTFADNLLAQGSVISIP